MIGLKKIAAVLAVGMSLSVFAGCGLVVKTEEAIAREEAEKRGVVLAEGDGIKVTLGEVLDDYEKLMVSWTAQYSEETMKSLAAQFEQQKIQIMDTKLRNQLMVKKADELKIPTDSPEMIQEYEKIVKDAVAELGSQAEYDKTLSNAGYTADSYKQEVLKGLRLEKLLEEVTKDITVSEAEINEYYEKNKATTYTKQPGATMYHIFFGKPDDAGAEAKAKEAKAKLDGGAKFEDIAKEYGQDDSAKEGGLLGTFPWDTQELGADFVAEAKKLTEGQISGPVKTSFGWHLIKVTNVLSAAKVLVLTDKVTGDDGVERTVKEEIETTLKSSKKNEKVAALLDEWEAQYNVKRYPERIPMEYQTEPETTQPGTTTPAPTSQGVTTPTETK